VIVAALSTTTSTTLPPSTTSSSSSSTTSTSSTTSSTTTSTLPHALTLAAGGDVLGDRGVGAFMDAHGGPAVFAKVKPYLEKAQLAFVNLECPISDLGTRKAGKQYTFRGRAVLTEGLVSAGIDVVSMANNHVLDYGQAAFKDTLLRLNAAGIAHAGAGLDSTAAATPALLITPAGTVAVLAFTEIIPSDFAATADQGGINPVTPDRKRMLASIKAAAAKADFVVVSIHWGIEYTGQANSVQRVLAHQVIDAGADVILGHHPHVIQGIEVYRDRLIAYSLGDFVFDHYSRQTGEAFVLQITLPRTGPPSVNVVPVYLNDQSGVPTPVSGEEADVILGRLIKQSGALGTKLVQEGDRARLADDPVVTP
jgi:poly-gamma-glutamate capsule biosynthesis protein CapA/YwtB (metallophosphatase superfamily)